MIRHLTTLPATTAEAAHIVLKCTTHVSWSH